MSPEERQQREALALLTYMTQHNIQHAMELATMADNIAKMGIPEVAAQMKEAVSDYEKGNMRLSVALSALKGRLGEV